MTEDKHRWSQPFAALLGAFDAQIGFGLPSIGGKDSMSGSFEQIDVPPTLVSFAIGVQQAPNIITPEFKQAGSRVYLLRPAYNENKLPDFTKFCSISVKISMRKDLPLLSIRRL